MAEPRCAIDRFLSRLWSWPSDITDADSSPCGAWSGSPRRPANIKIKRSLASYLVCPSDDSDGDALDDVSGSKLKATAISAVVGQSENCPRARSRSRSGQGQLRPEVRKIHDEHISFPCWSVRSAGMHMVKFEVNQASNKYSSKSDDQHPRTLWPKGCSLRIGSRCFRNPGASFVDKCPLAKFQLDELASIPMVNVRLLPSGQPMINVLDHCYNQIAQLREDYCGVCVFKIGISANVGFRMSAYARSNFSEMRLLHATNVADHAAILEVLLIREFKGHTGCRNIAPGGDGSMKATWGPFFVYCVAARADRKLPVGS